MITTFPFFIYFFSKEMYQSVLLLTYIIQINYLFIFVLSKGYEMKNETNYILTGLF